MQEETSGKQEEEVIEEDLDEMEQNFEKIVHELVNDRSLDKFREEYEKLHDALIQSHEHNSVLLEKCHQLNKDILINANKISAVLTMSQNDQKTIASLRNEFEKAWKMVETSQEREAKSREIILALRDEIQNLTFLVSQTADVGVNVVPVKDTSMQSVTKSNSALKSEIKSNESQILALIRESDKLREEKSVIIAAIEVFKNEEQKYQQEIAEAEAAEESLYKEQDTMMENMNVIKEKIKTDEDAITATVSKIEQGKEHIETERKTLRDCERDRIFYIDENRMRKEKISETKKGLLAAQKVTNRKREEVSDMQHRLTDVVAGSADIFAREKSLTTELEQNKRSLGELKKTRREVMECKKEYFDELSKMRKDVVKLGSNVRGGDLSIRLDNIAVAAMDREQRDVTNKHEIEKLNTLDQIKQREIVERDFADVKKDGHRKREHLEKVDIERNAYLEKVSYHKANMNQVLDDIDEINRMNDELTLDLQKVKEEIQRQVVLCDGLRSERDAISRQLHKWWNENAKYEEENGTLSMMISQMKTDIKNLDRSLVHNHIQTCNLRNRNAEREREVNNLENHLIKLEEKIVNTEHQIQTLLHQKHEADVDIQSLSHRSEFMRDNIRKIEKEIDKRNIELEQIREKAAVQKDLLRMGGSHYETKRQEVVRLHETLNIHLKKQGELLSLTKHVEAAKKERDRLEKELLQTQGMASALTQESETPRRIPDIIMLESTNPELYELIKMKEALISKIYNRIHQMEKLKAESGVLQKKLNYSCERLQKTHGGGKFQEEMTSLTKALKKKEEMLAQMQTGFSLDNLKTEKTKIDVVKSMIREQKMETNENKVLINELRHSICAPRSGSPSHRAPGRFNMGGGFGVGSVEMSLPEIPKLGADRAKSNRLQFRNMKKQVTIAVPISARLPGKRLCNTPKSNSGRMMLSARLPTEDL